MREGGGLEEGADGGEERLGGGGPRDRLGVFEVCDSCLM